MSEKIARSSDDANSRRDFLKTSTATFVGAALAGGLAAPAVHAAGGDTLRIGLVGCGGRGTGAANQAMNADSNCKLVAMGDVFPDRLESSREQLRKLGGAKFDVTDDRSFSGFDAFKKVIDSDIDVVLLCTPPNFRPAQLKYAIEKGKHVFAEKPVAVDGPGIRSVVETCKEAKKKNLSIVSGLCWRYDKRMQETIQRIHDGAIGDVIALQCNYNTGLLWNKPRQESWTDMEWQLRNWLYFTWLSGDHNVEQHVHSLDKMAWVLHDQYPVKCFGLGGRQARTAPEWGNIFDHHAVCYEFADGRRCFSYCRQQDKTAYDTSDWIFGSNGTASLIQFSIKGKSSGDDWKWVRNRQAPPGDMYQNEHDALFAAIRSGKPIDNGDYMTKSSLMAIMGRMATYTGQTVTWEQALNSTEDLQPAVLEFGTLATPPVAIPGATKLT